MNISGLKFEAMCGEHDVRLNGELTWFVNDDKTWAPDTSEMDCPREALSYSCVESWQVNMVGEEAELIETWLKFNADTVRHDARHGDEDDEKSSIELDLLIEKLYGEV